MIKIEDIESISKLDASPGYVIPLTGGRSILMHKRRTIPALLLLIAHGEACEKDLAGGSDRLKTMLVTLGDRVPAGLILEKYGDANKPFSELWNEEGFGFIQNPAGERRLGSKMYVLEPGDHDKLFAEVRKASRRSPGKKAQDEIGGLQGTLCNICGAAIYTAKAIHRNAFSKDRMRRTYDHRVPVDRGGTSDPGNFQALCFYCNKSKWQICNICHYKNCNQDCVLAFPERSTIIAPTGEDIADRMNRPAILVTLPERSPQ